MRILFTRFPLESALGGAEIQTLSLMKGLSERGHAVEFLGSCAILLQEAAGYGLPVTRLDIGPPPVSAWSALSFLWRKTAMREQLENALSRYPDLDAVVMLSLSEKLLLTEAAVKRGIQVFWVEHDRVGRWLTKNPWLPMLRKLSGTVTTVCVSELSRQIYIGLGWNPKKVIAIPNGIDLGRFAPQPSPRPSPTAVGEGDLLIGCVARLSHEKGVDLLIEAVKNTPHVHLAIVGKGPEEEHLRMLMGGYEDRVRLLPRVENLAEFYRTLDALVLPSRDNDPFGLVVTEAMSTGTPVIVTDACGIAGYVKDGTDAIIVKSNSAAALREGIARLRDAALRKTLQENGPVTALKKFSLPAMIDIYEQFIVA